jgi:O-antigen/teichoic acid export membrane protein
MLLIYIAAVPGIFALPLLYGREFSDVVEQSLILLPGVILISIAGVLAQHFSGTGLPIALPLFWVVGLVSNTIANLMVVPKYGAVGAAVTSAISYALVFALISIYFRIRTGNTLRDAYIIRGDEVRALLDVRRIFQ